MLFNSIVFMNRTLRRQWISVFLVFAIKLNIASNSQTPHEKPVKFDGDFDSFLKDLGSMVYKSKKPGGNVHETKPTYVHTHTTVAPKTYRRSQNVFNTQKAFLADVLMMKLVSYYEDKYKLTHLASTTTERITLISSLNTNRLKKYTVDHSNIDKNEVFNVQYNKPPSRDTHELNRRMQRERLPDRQLERQIERQPDRQLERQPERHLELQPDMRKMDEYPEPEVVIL